MRKLPLNWIAIQSLTILVLASGCAMGGRQFHSGKRAMDDVQYAQEHGEPYSSDPQVRRAQKAWDRKDASFQEGKIGVYAAGGSTGGGVAANRYPDTVGSMGLFQMPTSWSTVHYGVMGMDKNGIGVAGFEAGARLHAPTRFTPYVGMSTDVGFSSMHTGHTRYSTGHPRTVVSKPTGIVAIVPEAGVSYWLTSSTRLNLGASYYVGANQPDFVLFAMSLEYILADGFGSKNNDSSVPQRISGDGNVYPADDDLEQYFLENRPSLDAMNLVPGWLPDTEELENEDRRMRNSDLYPDTPVPMPDLPPLLSPRQDPKGLDSADELTE